MLVDQFGDMTSEPINDKWTYSPKYGSHTIRYKGQHKRICPHSEVRGIMGKVKRGNEFFYSGRQHGPSILCMPEPGLPESRRIITVFPGEHSQRHDALFYHQGQ
jgi:hypothetical protein